MEIVIRGTRETSYMVMLKGHLRETFLGNYETYRDAEIARTACERLLNRLKDQDKLS